MLADASVPCNDITELKPRAFHVNKEQHDSTVKIETQLDEWLPVSIYAPEMVDTYLNLPREVIPEEGFKFLLNEIQENMQIQDIMLAHKIIESGVPNYFGCRIPLHTNWNLNIFKDMLLDYQDIDVINWLKYGFSISRADAWGDPQPATCNHKGAMEFPTIIDEYIINEINHGSTLGPFKLPPFTKRIGILPLSTRPKRNSNKRRVIMDLSFPLGHSVNDGISKFHYCGQEICLTYPTIDTLARRIVELGGQEEVRIWKKDMVRAFRQIPLCPMDYSLIGFRWRNLLFFDKVVPMGLRLAAYICQRVTSAIVNAHRQLGYWSINYLDDFGGAEKYQDAWASYNLFWKILNAIGVQEAEEKSVPPTTHMEFLGNTVDTVKQTLEVSEDRKDELMYILNEWTSKEWFTKKELQSLIGKLSFVTNCVRPEWVFISRLLEVLRNTKEGSKYQVQEEMSKDINWWRQYLPKFSGVCMLWLQDVKEYDKLLASDASLIGGGGIHDKEYFHVKFPQEIINQTSNIAQREMVTILIAVKLWARKLKGKVVRFYTDNENCMYAIKCGRSHDEFMLKCLRDLVWITAENEILLRCKFVRSRQNLLPDALSRWYQSGEARRIFKRNTDRTWKRRSVTNELTQFISSS